MFFCINLVFATSNTDDTREVVEEEVADIVIDLSDNEYVLTNVVIDPLTKSNVYTYIVKENVPISFNMINENIDPKQATLQKYYYRTVKNRNVRIRCLDTIYADKNIINIIPDASFDRLKITNMLLQLLSNQKNHFISKIVGFELHLNDLTSSYS